MMGPGREGGSELAQGRPGTVQRNCPEHWAVEHGSLTKTVL